MEWIPEQTALLIRLWSKGFSASQIAAELGDRFTRNSVIGKAHRLQQKGMIERRISSDNGEGRGVIVIRKRVRDHRAERERRRQLATERGQLPKRPFLIRNGPSAPAQPLWRKVEPVRVGEVSLIELGYGHCRWIMRGTGAAAKFCGQATEIGESWCSEHCARAFTNWEVAQGSPSADWVSGALANPPSQV